MSTFVEARRGEVEGPAGQPGRSTELVARASQVRALLDELEEHMRAVPPEALVALLAAQPGGHPAEPYPLARAWLGALRSGRRRAWPGGAAPCVGPDPNGTPSRRSPPRPGTA